ncbi:peptide chain release factor N(5)-glutamine methyltransferase [Gilvimarinus xylanilyticus]|uniref:Release factor glutamine methyltransferase n=1 Tax=Gilvimarinus xylanilyticus TaxID=2944139 RepID=A0A9X2I2F6_9GAMM|nr:peptide chain release factor N(5)-glutamine methyltransferase [Gilvimarinus xylanilyticus]MCP8899105.1 peptide chain release factor N(5)-glutamine methyltransferase [Gilvimarinus xylanilyticus]
MPSIQESLRAAAQQLSASSDSARLDAEVLLAFVLQCSRTYLFTWPEKTLASEPQAQFEALVRARQNGKPIAYLTGQQEFWSLPLHTAPDTLIPRADTELLVETALQLPVSDRARVLDLGTGTGAIALAIASEKPDWVVTAVDKMPGAVTLAARNSEALQLPIQVLQSDWFSALSREPGFDIIVSNPPYIAADDLHLAQGDVRFEPASALTAGADGLDDIRLIATQARDYLTPGGWLLVEHGWQQASDVQALFTEAGFAGVRSEKDLAGHDRITLGRFTFE